MTEPKPRRGLTRRTELRRTGPIRSARPWVPEPRTSVEDDFEEAPARAKLTPIVRPFTTARVAPRLVGASPVVVDVAEVEAIVWPVKQLRELVKARAGYACDRCARNLIGQQYSIQHRRARGAAGRAGRVLDTPWNLVVLCGSATSPGCHNLVENVARAEAYAQGFAIRGEVQDPAQVPIFRHLREWVIPSVDESGGGVWVPAEAIAA